MMIQAVIYINGHVSCEVYNTVQKKIALDIGIWNENLLDLKLIERAMIPGKADDLKDTGLILSDDIIENK